MYRALAILMLMISCNITHAATSANANSPMGINLDGVNYFAPEMPFMNTFSTANHWITHGTVWDTGEEQYLNLDADGWPKTLTSINEPGAQQFTNVGVLFLQGFTTTSNGVYPAGQYVVLYDGQGTLSYGFDARLVSSAPGRDVVNIATPTNNGVDFRITATDPNHTGNYLKNIRFVKAEYETSVKAGNIFNPTFLSLLKNFHALRFMDWFNTNNSTLASWANRPLPTNAFFGGTYGVPIEIALQLCNAIGADAWMNVPIMADDNFITQMATLVHNQLGSSQKIYVELSNEVWNFSFSQYSYALNQGQALWPTQPGGGNGFEWNREWFGMRTAQMCDLWKAVWGADTRFVCVLGAQAANAFTATESLKCPYWTQGAPCSGHNISAVAMAPYMGGAVPSAWTSLPDGGLANLFQSLYSQNDPTIPVGGFIAQNAKWMNDFTTHLAPYGLPLISYEGGQTFTGNGTAGALNNLYMAANRDPRMATAYATYFQQWKTLGGQLFMYFDDIATESKYGSWGALETIMQTTVPLSSAPPKWQGIQNFISSTPCWWANCASSITQSPPVPPPAPPPTNLQVH